MLQKLTPFLFFASFWIPLFMYANEQYTEVPEVSCTEGLPSSLINGSVCAISGEFRESTIDAVIPGAEPLIIGRNYANKSNPFSSLNQIDSLSINYLDETKKPLVVVRLRQSNGSQIDFVHSDDKKAQKLNSRICRLKSPKGLTNGASRLSGCTNLKNQSVILYKKKKNVVVINGAGDKSTFSWTSDFSCRQKELKKINGSTCRYQRDASKTNLSSIVCSNRKMTHDFSSAQFTYSKNKDFSISTVHTSDGKKIKYSFGRSIAEVNDDPAHLCARYYLQKIENSSAPDITYYYIKKSCSPEFQISAKVLPEDRYLSNFYYEKGSNRVGNCLGNIEIKSSDDYRLNRIMLQKAPVGTDKKPHVTHRFVYRHKNRNGYGKAETFGGTTDVYDAYGHLVQYTSDKFSRLKMITFFMKKTHQEPYCKERFKWGKGAQEGNLKSKFLMDEKNSVYYGRLFSYDSKGNVVKNSLCGKLTGMPSCDIILNKKLSIQNDGFEKETRTYTYSNDERNLVMSETDSNGVMTIYDYVKETNRVKAKWIIYEGSIQLREFYKYDSDFVVIEKITDDGKARSSDDLTGVTQRRYTHTIPRGTAPIGYPEKVLECYLNLHTGEKKLLTTKVFDFSRDGHLLKEELYDENNQFMYALSWEYDAYGNIIKESNALGETSFKKYDANNNLIFQQGPHPDFYIRNTYDYSNRLIKRQEKHKSGQRFVNTYTYNRLGQCTSTANAYGHETKQEYDSLGRIIRTEFPSLINAREEKISPVITQEYDIAGHPTVVTDPEGNKTITTYNIRGQPLHIAHPDGTTEAFIYRLDGQLLAKSGKNKIRTLYKRDVRGRVIEESLCSADGSILKTKSFTYNALHLMSIVDETGLTTSFSYDFAGRLEWTFQGNHKQQNLYDSLGRHTQTREWYGQGEHEYKTTIKVLDALNREVEERIEDSNGTLLSLNRYAYDVNGNQTSIQKGDLIILTEYNAHNQPIKITNGLGDVSYITYDYAFINPYGQRVLRTTTTDPLGYQTLETYDTANQPVDVERKSPHQILLSKHTTFYNISGNITRFLNHLVKDGKVTQTIESLFFYGEDQQLTLQIDAHGMPEQKATRLYYNELRQKIRMTKHDGMHIFYAYDELGRLQTLKSSDFLIHYDYTYNLRDQPIRIADPIHQRETLRGYDEYGNMNAEVFENGLWEHYSHDEFGRVNAVIFSDGTSLKYTYDALNLKKIERLINGEVSYTHLNIAHTLSGMTTESILAGGTKICYGYDPLQRRNKIETKNYHQIIPEKGFDSAGNLKLYYAQGEQYEFSYDDLYQLEKEKNHNYQFDSLNNRTIKDGELHHYNALHQLIQKGITLFSYDLNGNLTKHQEGDQVTQYFYDALDRLIKISKGDQEISYVYDAFNRRISRIYPEIEQHFIYQGQEEVGLWEKGALKELFVQDKNGIAAFEINGQLHIPIQDLFGNVICVQNALGDLLEKYSYTAFGETQISGPNGETRTESSISNFRQYASKRVDPETGFIAFGFRYYDPKIGRWVSPDPAGSTDGPNLYAYVQNNPLIYQDEFGLFSILPIMFTPEDPHKEEVQFSFDNKIEHFSINTHVEEGMRWVNVLTHSLMKGIGFETTTYENYMDRPGIYDLNSLALKDSTTNETYNFRESKSYIVAMVNGIDTTKAEFKDNLLYLGKVINHNVVGIHSPSYGFRYDALRYQLASVGLASESSAKVQKLFTRYFSANPNGHILLYCHSRGVVDTRNALLTYPKELRNRIKVLAIAPGGFIPRSICASIAHLVCLQDVVPYLSFLTMLQSIHTTTFVSGNFKTPLKNHSFQNEIYREEIETHYENFARSHSMH